MAKEKTMKKTDGYKRPKKTFQDKLTAEEIKEKLEDYIEISDISKVPNNSHIRYFSIIKNGKRKKKVFRLGGYLKNKNNADKFVMLTNGDITWSVQTQTSIFFRRMTFDEIKEQYEDEIEDLKKKMSRLKKQNKLLKEKIKSYEK